MSNIRTQMAMIALLQSMNPQHYKKSGVFTYRVAIGDETIVTQLPQDNKPEVTAPAVLGDYILKGSAGEEYVIKPATFPKRYSFNTDGTAVAKGECWGAKWNEEDTEFVSPWKDKDGGDIYMIIKKSDMLVSPNPEFTEVYRVARNEFDNPSQGYKLVTSSIEVGADQKVAEAQEKASL